MNGILFVLKTGLRWNHLPTVLGFGSGATCWRRLNDWRKAGVWDRLHELLLDKLREAGQIDFIRCRRFLVGTSRWGGRKTGPNPTDRSRPGSKHHILVDAKGVPISAILTGANRNDVPQFAAARRRDSADPWRARRPLQRPKVIYADRGYDSDPYIVNDCANAASNRWTQGAALNMAGLGKFRRVVERTHSWLHNSRRLRIRFDRRADIHEAFLKFGYALVCWNIFRHTKQPFLTGLLRKSRSPRTSVQ
ncbi:IS5 family transposase [Paraburkholderia sediminicola]|uniref:IS5 family transposase n=1 Tax=Paraburkholderia sediminicola TaxID=458836 RepID=UPI0038BAA1D3